MGEKTERMKKEKGGMTMLELVPLTAAFMLGCIVLIALSEDETLEERARREARKGKR